MFSSCSYLYAPKDDCKHRAYWRELYTVEEADHLQSLITAAGDRNINFYYAISPGLDITYSNSKEVSGGSPASSWVCYLMLMISNAGGHVEEEAGPGRSARLQGFCSSLR